jgi:elongator complex protein 2
MILGAAWAPAASTEPVFATAGRDKSVKIWQKAKGEDNFRCQTTIALTSAVSAIAFLSSPYKNSYVLAAGEDSGAISIHRIDVQSLDSQHVISIDQRNAPSRAITQLSWRPVSAAEAESFEQFELAVASEDTSARIYTISNIA